MSIEEIITQDRTIDDDLRLKVINHLLDMENNTLVNSRLNKSQINAITKLLTFSRIFKNDLTLKIAYDMLKLQVSLQGLGRKELVRILQTTSDYEPESKSSFKDVFRWVQYINMNTIKDLQINSGFYVAIGQQGSGKTAFITYLALSEYQKTKRLVLSNYTLYDIPCIYYDDKVLIDLLTSDTLIDTVYIPRRFKDEPYNIAQEYYKIMGVYPKSNDDYLNNSIILLDEIHVYYDSYDTFKRHPRVMSGFISQLRKRKILLLGTTQRLLKIPIRMRSEIKYVLDMREHNGLFKCVFNEMDGYYYKPVKSITIDLRNYFKYYNTDELIKP